MSKHIKEQRERLGRELNYIAALTKIKASYLKAIEEEDFAKLPAEVYTKGYIRQYAKFLEVSPDATIMSYNAYLEKLKGATGKKSKENPSPTSQNTAPKIDMAKKSWKEYLHSKGFSQKLLLGFSLAIAAVIIYLLIPSKSNVSSAPQKIQTDIQISASLTNSPMLPQEIPLEKDGLVSPTVITNMHDNKNKIAQKRYLLDITAMDRTWVQIVIDGIDKKEILLNAGERVNYEANQTINVLIGNASGVKLKFNGKEFENLGEKGQVIKLSFPHMQENSSIQQNINPESPLQQSSNTSNLHAYN
jgi:cytoskeletal protein RodZ